MNEKLNMNRIIIGADKTRSFSIVAASFVLQSMQEFDYKMTRFVNIVVIVVVLFIIAGCCVLPDAPGPIGIPGC